MTLDDIKAKADQFFEWPSEKRESVTYTSAMLFAWDCVKDDQERREKHMTPHELATMLNGAEYPFKLWPEHEAAKHGLVVVYGASDDLIEFEGAIDDEAGAYGGDPICFDKEGPLEAWETLDKDVEDDVRAYFKRKDNHRTITPIWSEGEYSWQYQTDIPHATFDIMENGEKYCRGIVFHIDSLTGTNP